MNKENGEGAIKQAWTQPTLRKLAAGSAETGSNANEDGNGDPTNARS